MSDAIRHRLFSAGFAAIAATRADRWLRGAALGRGVILTFHHVRPRREDSGFAPNRLLEITPEFLDRVLEELGALGFDLVGLDDVPGRLQSTIPDAKPFAVLTFDDGYRDVAEYAAPVLRRHGAPWTFFVTTDFADGRGRLWWLELEEAIRRLDRVAVRLSDGTRIAAATGSAAQKQAVFRQIYWRLRSGPEEILRETVAVLANEAGLDAESLVRDLCLDWSELKALIRSEPALTIGAHTLSHPMLAKHDAETARREIEASRDRIERELGVAVDHFAYPVGDPGSAGTREFLLSREAGFQTAVTTRPGHVFAAHAEYLSALPRISVNGLHQSSQAIRALLSGVPFLAWNRGRRLNVG